MKRFLSLILALLLVAFIAYAGRDTSTARLQAAMCLPKPTLMQRGTMIASDIGSIIPALSKPLPTERVATNIKGAWYTLGYWLGVMGAAMGGKPAPDPVIEPVDCAALLNPCVTTPPTAPKTAEPYDPKVASVDGIKSVTAAARKYWKTPSTLRLAVAIAGAESGYKADPENPPPGMRGVWQINENEHPKLFAGRDWRNIEDNAWMAFQVYEAAGNSFDPWSTYGGGGYAKHLDEAQEAIEGGLSPAAAGGAGGRVAMAGVAPAPVAPVAGRDQPPTPNDCTSGGVGGLTIGSWNVLYTNTAARVNGQAGFADLVGLQEIRDKHRPINVPGYDVTPGAMAVPIIWNTSKLEMVSWKREYSMKGCGTHKWVVYGIWRNKATGQQFGAVNTHQYVNGGRCWDVQAKKVDQVRERLSASGLPVVLLGDMNASSPKIRAAFGSAGQGNNIDRIIGFGATPTKMETLDEGGSDHNKIRATFAAAAGVKIEAPRGTTSTAATGSGRAGAKAAALKMNASYASYHADPQGQPSMDMGIRNKTDGYRIARHLIDNRTRYDVEYVIFNERIYSDNRGWDTGSPYTRRAAGDWRHAQHVHATFHHG